MEEQRKRLNSSMTYEEYVNTFDKAPKKPCLKPKQEPDVGMEDLDLLSDAQTEIVSINLITQQPQVKKKIYCDPNTVIQEVEEDGKTPVVWVDQQLTPSPMKMARQRTQSENIQFTFISFVEREIERKGSRKFE
ncbi:unnamed protein product (macronuclear) [Paramecium tetraurelia]|uniref:Uncharacterized protein n=1 Tax=Paramecium tetraurelia TaxID=5888 RepID=A0D9Q3_PARTE|nr:uncharacterized protein GSPATT00014701001 [Paramecium tetraurelia]CAK79770.1 unnamed protein product [Paramecium tetraurelia]|eukprot:XP_001447167.1 hypothetical protein (macronuclear) [Paramecium tetraurelia strain d4-2]